MRKFLGNLLALVAVACWDFSSGFAPQTPTRVMTSLPYGAHLHNGRAKALNAIAFDPRWGNQQQQQQQQQKPKRERRREDRFERTAAQDIQAQAPCIMEIDGVKYNMTAWAKAHPGGENILLKFHNKDASKAFHAAGHSKKAYEMLKDFAIAEGATAEQVAVPERSVTDNIPRWRKKLFTKEDPIGIHKYMGIFVLLHFLFCYGQMYFGDPSCGLGTRLGKGPSIFPALCLIPHAVLSLSSLIFHTVPKERVVGQPMIWQEFRLHNISFGVRSVVAAALAWASYYSGHNPAVRRIAIWGSCASVLVAQYAADLGTKYLRINNAESTTATMPYWDDCSVETQKRFKTFYAYCQFLATLACAACGNPAWPLSVLVAIQMASLLMTLVRKGLISARAYHMGYTTTLIMPWIVGLRSLAHGPDFLAMMGLGWLLYQLRRQGINKYALWVPVLAARIAVGDQFLAWQVY